MASRLPHCGPIPVPDGRDRIGSLWPAGPVARRAGHRHGHEHWHESAFGAICTLSLSFNNDGPLGAYFRYVCDNGTYIARYDDLYDGKDELVDLSGVAVSNNGIELIDREFLSAISEGREPNGSVKQCLPAMQTMDRIEKSFQS